MFFNCLAFTPPVDSSRSSSVLCWVLFNWVGVYTNLSEDSWIFHPAPSHIVTRIINGPQLVSSGKSDERTIAFDNIIHVFPSNSMDWIIKHEFIYNYRIRNETRFLSDIQKKHTPLQALHHTTPHQSIQRVLTLMGENGYYYLCAFSNG